MWLESNYAAGSRVVGLCPQPHCIPSSIIPMSTGHGDGNVRGEWIVRLPFANSSDRKVGVGGQNKNKLSALYLFPLGRTHSVRQGGKRYRALNRCHRLCDSQRGSGDVSRTRMGAVPVPTRAYEGGRGTSPSWTLHMPPLRSPLDLLQAKQILRRCLRWENC